MGRHGRDQSLSYLLAELESSNPQRIFPASGFLGKTYALRLSGCISPIPCGLGWRMGRHDPETDETETIDHPQRISKKNGRSGIRPGWSPVPASRFLGNEVASINLPLRLSGCISPLYPVGRGWKMGRHGRDQSLSYLLAELESSNPHRDRDHPQRISKKNGRSGIRPGWSP